MEKGKLILLNGASSSGKTTLANELLKHLPDYFHYGLDNFDLVIDAMEDRKARRLIPVETEYFFHRTITMFSDKGINLIVDHVLDNQFTRDDCRACLAGYPLLFVGVHCPVAELERRERERGDRTIGLATSQLGFIHQGEVYDVEVDTFVDSVETCAAKILQRISVAGFPPARLTLSGGTL